MPVDCCWLYLPTPMTTLLYWQVKNKGGRREHQVVLAADVSHSMYRSHDFEAAESLLMLIEALQQHDGVGLSVITFGERVTVVKTEEQPWDERSQYMLLANLAFDQQSATQDAAAIDVACELMQSSAAPKPSRHVFVLTDGYGTGGRLQMSHALLRAQGAGVNVTGIGIGLQSTGVSATYQNWVTAATPRQLAQALEQLFNPTQGESRHNLQAAGSPAAQDYLSALTLSPLITGAASAESVDAVLQAAQTKVFEGLVRSLGGAAQLQINSAQPDHMTIDMAFILDVTGSMTAWLEACKAQIKYIATEITPKITKRPEFEGRPHRTGTCCSML